VDADLVAIGTTTAVVTVAVDDAIPVATTVTEETAVGTGVPVAANVTAEAMDVRDPTGEGDASGVGVSGDAATVAAVVMVATDVGETVGTDWLDAADGGIKATRRPATANTGMTRRLNVRRWGWTTNVTPSRCPKARSRHRHQLFGSGVLDHHNGLHARGSCSCMESTGRKVPAGYAVLADMAGSLACKRLDLLDGHAMPDMTGCTVASSPPDHGAQRHPKASLAGVVSITSTVPGEAFIPFRLDTFG
jgi:hypothetical protein